MRRHAEESKCSIGTFQQKNHENEDVFDDDCMATSTVVGKAAQALKSRFLERITEVYCGHRAWHFGAIVMMKGDVQTCSVKIWIVPFVPDTMEDNWAAPAILLEMADCMSRINKSSKSHLKLAPLVHRCVRRHSFGKVALEIDLFEYTTKDAIA